MSKHNSGYPVILQTAATETGNGMTFNPSSSVTLTFEISGTSSSRTVVFELAGPKGVFKVYPAIKIDDTTYTPVTSTTIGNNEDPASYEVDVPAGYSFRARVSAVAGGNISIIGWAVAE